MNKQQGFTLIELMIASLISIFLMAGIMNLFITTNRTVSLSDALSQNQETGRFSMDYLTRFIRKAGYSQDATLTPPELMIPNVNPSFLFTCVGNQADACSANNPNPATILGDRLSIVYVASAVDGTLTCTGRAVGGAANGQQVLADVFWVSNTGDTQGELRCRTFDITANNWLDDGTVSVINNIETFEFQVGLADKGNDPGASRYVNIDTVIADDALIKIRSLRIAILTTSTDDLNPNTIKTRVKARHYGVLDAPQSATELTFTDGNLRNLFISTIELPSAIEGAILNKEES